MWTLINWKLSLNQCQQEVGVLQNDVKRESARERTKNPICEGRQDQIELKILAIDWLIRRETSQIYIYKRINLFLSFG